MLPTVFIKPKYRAALQDVTIELWEAQRKLPFNMRADAIVVPVAPDLKMVFGIAKIAKEYSANKIQVEADQAAPLAPGKAFLGSGARYRYKNTALAVIFDEMKRTSPELITQAVRNAFLQAQRRGAQSIILPDMTENLLAQPNWITEEQRAQTAGIVARVLIDSIVASRGIIPNVKIWVWDPKNTPAYIQELQALEAEGMTARAQQIAAPAAAVDSEETLEEPRRHVEPGRSAQIRETILTAVVGDPLTLSGDALLLPTATTPELASAPAARVEEAAPADTPERLATRLAARGGSALQEAARALGTLPLGNAAVTGASGLPRIPNILYLAAREPNAPAMRQALEVTLREALELADERGYKSLIIPNLGGEGSDYPARIAAMITVDTLAAYLKQPNYISDLRHIYLVAQTEEEEEAVRDAVEKYIPDPLVAMLVAAGTEHH